MAKRQPKNQLGDWLEEVPDAVQDAADAYDKAHTAKSKADGKLNTAKERVIEQMKDHNCPRVRVRNGAKILVLASTDKVKYEKPADSSAGISIDI